MFLANVKKIESVVKSIACSTFGRVKNIEPDEILIGSGINVDPTSLSKYSISPDSRKE